MANSVIYTPTRNAKRVLTTNSTDTSSFSIPADTATAPTDQSGGYVDMADIASGGTTNTAMVHFLVQHGTAAEAKTASVQCYGVEIDNDATATIYSHIPLWEVDLIGGSLATGETDEAYCDTITESSNLCGAIVRNAEGSADFGNSIAHLVMDQLGFRWLYFQFDIGDAVAVNAIIRGF